MYDTYHRCVYSDGGQRNCLKHVEFYSKSKCEKLVHLSWFYYKNLSRRTVTWTSNSTVNTLLPTCGKVRPGRAADHSPPSSAAVMEEYSYTSTHPLGHTGPVTGTLYLYSHSLGVCIYRNSERQQCLLECSSMSVLSICSLYSELSSVWTKQMASLNNWSSCIKGWPLPVSTELQDTLCVLIPVITQP